MKVTIVPIVIDALGTITKGLLKALEDMEVGGRVETIQTTALLRTARILRRVLETALSVVRRQPLLRIPLSNSLLAFPYPLPVTPRSRIQNTLSGFASKQTKESSA